MQSLLAVYVCMCATLLLGRMSSSEPFVSLKFYGPRIIKINVKKYVLLGESDVTVGCSVEDLPAPPETNGAIYLYQNGAVEDDVISSHGNLHLIWNAATVLFNSSFVCEAYLTTNNFTTHWHIMGSEVVLQHYSEVSDPDIHCLPTGAGFLSNEVVTIVCLSRRDARWFSDEDLDEDVLLEADDKREIENNFRVTTNNILLNSDVKNARCEAGNGPSSRSCSVELQPLSTGLDISITPDTFDESITFDQMVFTCVSNVPTDRISWRLDSTNGNILDFGYVEESKLNFSITHSSSTSQLMVETQVENVLSVSCKTSRAGYVAVATVNNDVIRNIPTSTSVPTQNVSSTQTSHFIIIIVILVVALFCVILFLVFQKFRRSQEKVMGSQEVPRPRPTADTLTSDNPYYYATSYDAQHPETKDDANGDGNKIENRSAKVTKTETVDHLTMDVLGDGAVVTLNEAYQIT